VEGYVLPASHARKGRRHQFVFLNGRPVEDAVISRALAEGFRGAVSDGLHPAAWLWIDLEPTLVDVNVHPAKREVRFHRPVDVRDAILEAVAGGLRPAPPVRPAGSVQQVTHEITRTAGMVEPVVPVFHPPATVLADWQESLPEPSLAQADVPAVAGGKTPEFRLFGLLHHRYVLLESDDGLVLFDPKAAWERIFYEKLVNHGDGVLETQGLLVPVLLELDPRDLDLVLRERMALQEAGIEVEAFGGNTLQVRSLPAFLAVDDPRPFLGGLMDELLHDSAPGTRFAIERLARVLAKRASVLRVPKLAETQALLEKLFLCELPYCAADGRPTLTEFSLRELERRFGNGRA
jgi:DNA mismatch repair protein MutL